MAPKSVAERLRARGGMALQTAAPVFTQEGPNLYAQAYARNKQYAKPGPYNTPLGPLESHFRAWVAQNKVPFDPNAKVSDYDMRGYWLANRNAAHAPGQHFPDTFKTPYDTTFSAESRYALPNTPFVWQGNQLVNRETGRVIFSQ